LGDQSLARAGTHMASSSSFSGSSGASRILDREVAPIGEEKSSECTESLFGEGEDSEGTPSQSRDDSSTA